MNTISTAFNEWTRQVQLAGDIDLSAATAILKIVAPGIDDAEGDAWWNAVAAAWGRLKLIRGTTYVDLRSFADGNETVTDELFDSFICVVNMLPESGPVNSAIQDENTDAEFAIIDPNIAVIEGFKTGGSSVNEVQLDQALDVAINALRGRGVELDEEIKVRQPQTLEKALAVSEPTRVTR